MPTRQTAHKVLIYLLKQGQLYIGWTPGGVSNPCVFTNFVIFSLEIYRGADDIDVGGDRNANQLGIHLSDRYSLFFCR